jgi:hypothetical protein
LRRGQRGAIRATAHTGAGAAGAEAVKVVGGWWRCAAGEQTRRTPLLQRARTRRDGRRPSYSPARRAAGTRAGTQGAPEARDSARGASCSSVRSALEALSFVGSAVAVLLHVICVRRNCVRARQPAGSVLCCRVMWRVFRPCASAPASAGAQPDGRRRSFRTAAVAAAAHARAAPARRGDC